MTLQEEIALKTAAIEAAWPEPYCDFDGTMKTPSLPESMWGEIMKLEMLKDITVLTEPMDPEWFFGNETCLN